MLTKKFYEMAIPEGTCAPESLKIFGQFTKLFLQFSKDEVARELYTKNTPVAGSASFPGQSMLTGP